MWQLLKGTEPGETKKKQQKNLSHYALYSILAEVLSLVLSRQFIFSSHNYVSAGEVVRKLGGKCCSLMCLEELL